MSKQPLYSSPRELLLKRTLELAHAIEMLEAEKLMTEVNTLVDNALPPFYLEISGEKNPDYNEEFYQFLIPSIEQETLT